MTINAAIVSSLLLSQGDQIGEISVVPTPTGNSTFGLLSYFEARAKRG